MADIDSIARRPAAYLAETGVPALAAGLLFSILGGSDLAQQFLPATFVARESPKWLAICCCAAVLWGAKVARERLVFPRGGYVELPRRSLSAVVAIVMFALVGFAGVLALSGYHLPKPDGKLLVPGFAVLFAGISLASGLRQRSSLQICFGVYLLCLAPLLWWLPVSSVERNGALEVLAGVPLAAGGAIRLRSFVRANPPGDER
jgi:hypothetical protein